jgi:hypothetical protein
MKEKKNHATSCHDLPINFELLSRKKNTYKCPGKFQVPFVNNGSYKGENLAKIIATSKIFMTPYI